MEVGPWVCLIGGPLRWRPRLQLVLSEIPLRLLSARPVGLLIPFVSHSEFFRKNLGSVETPDDLILHVGFSKMQDLLNQYFQDVAQRTTTSSGTSTRATEFLS